MFKRVRLIVVVCLFYSMVSNVCIGNRLLYEIATKIWTFQIMKMHWTCLISIMGKTCSIHESSRKKGSWDFCSYNTRERTRKAKRKQEIQVIIGPRMDQLLNQESCIIWRKPLPTKDWRHSKEYKWVRSYYSRNIARKICTKYYVWPVFINFEKVSYSSVACK